MAYGCPRQQAKPYGAGEVSWYKITQTLRMNLGLREGKGWVYAPQPGTVPSFELIPWVSHQAVGFLRTGPGLPHQPGKSGLHACGEGECVMALESREGTRVNTVEESEHESRSVMSNSS